MSELPAIIIDTGSGYTKIGFGEEMEPACIIPTVIAIKKPGCKADGPQYYIGEEALKAGEGYEVSHPVNKCQIDNWEHMEVIWEHLLKKILGVNPEGRRFLLAEPTENLEENRKHLGEIFFKKFKAHSICFMSEATGALCASWSKIPKENRSLTGVIVESGEEVTRVIPVIGGYVAPTLVRQIPVGGRDVTRFVQKSIHELDEHFPPSESFEIAKGIKEKFLYVCPNISKERAKFDAERDKHFRTHVIDDPVRHGQLKIVVGYERFLAPEILFEPKMISNDFTTPLSVVVDDVIQSCPIECRRDLYSNIVLDGGGIMFKDCERRLQRDVGVIVNHRQKQVVGTNSIAPKPIEVKVVWNRHMENYGVWFGGSLHASILAQPFITKAEYDKKEPSILMSGWYYTEDPSEDSSEVKVDKKGLFREEIAKAKEKKGCAQEPDDWKAMILKCGVDEENANIIVKLFKENDIDISQFYDLTHELLKELGIKMGPRMKIMKYVEEHKSK